MARLLPIVLSLPRHQTPTIYVIVTFLAIMSLFSLIIFLCTSHKTHNKKLFIKKKPSISNKALLKMSNLWRKQFVEDEDEDEDDYGYKYNNNGANYDNNHNHFVVNDDDFVEENVLWKKTIFLGEKCKPLEFSGKIDYDSQGNLLSNTHKSIGNG